MTVSRQQIIEELGKVGFADVSKKTVRASDKIAALDNIAKVAGLYREEPSERDRLIKLTQVTIYLDHGEQGITEEVTQRGAKVAEGEAPLMEPEDTDPTSYYLIASQNYCAVRLVELRMISEGI